MKPSVAALCCPRWHMTAVNWVVSGSGMGYPPRQLAGSPRWSGSPMHILPAAHCAEVPVGAYIVVSPVASVVLGSP